MRLLKLVLVLIMFGNLGCKAQIKNKMENSNPLKCDPVSGVCEIPNNNTTLVNSDLQKAKKKLIKIIYFTDPICSSCWGIEPQIRKLKLEYGDNFEIEYRMGGLLPNWSYNSGGISKPSDVADHWDEVSTYYDMPIDGDVWLEDPLHSSFPPSIAFKAAQMQDNEKAILFLREIREMVFLQKKNITKWEHLEFAGKKVGLNVDRLKLDYNGKARELFEQDLKLCKELGVKGFPTMFFVDTLGQKEIVYGSKPYSAFESTLIQLFPSATKTSYEKSWSALFTEFHSLTAREFSELKGMDRKESEQLLNELTTEGKLEKLNTKNGAIWKLKHI